MVEKRMADEGEKRYTIGEFALLLGLSQRTIDYYTRQGLLRPEKTTPGHGYRHYTEEDRQRVAIIKQLQTRKFSLQEIRNVLTSQGSKAAPSAVERIERVNLDLEKLRQLVQETRSSAPGINESAMRVVATEALQKATGLCSLLVTLLQEMPNF
jgi:MerR family transcriptional regulator, copper efflux regulator